MSTAARSSGKSFARHVTDILEPKNWIIATAILIGWHSGGLSGIGWGLLGALFAAILPTAFIQYGMKRGRFADRNVGAREHRLTVMTFVIASVGTGLGLLTGLGAPRPVTAMTVTMLAAITVMMGITVKWKSSVHCAVSSGTAAMLALTYGAPWLTRLRTRRTGRLVPRQAQGPHLRPDSRRHSSRRAQRPDLPRAPVAQLD